MDKRDQGLEKDIEKLLAQGVDRETIRGRLAGMADPNRLDFYLRTISSPREREKFQAVNILLVLALGFVTIKKLFYALSPGSFDLFTLLALVVPTINIYIIREILGYRKTGYQFACVLFALSLLNAENRTLPEIVLIPLVTILSGFLWLRLFPVGRGKGVMRKE